MNNNPDIIDKFLTTKAVAEILSVSENTLKQWRSLRKGPGFIKFHGRFVRYPQSELRGWIEAEKAATGVY